MTAQPADAERERLIGRWNWGGRPSNFPLPRLSMGTFADPDDGWIALNFGDGNSDPIFYVQWEPRPGRTPWRLFDRFAEWHWQRTKRRSERHGSICGSIREQSSVVQQ